MFGVNRSWYLQQCLPATVLSLEEDTTLRDAVERLCLDFPGYGYRRVTAQLHRDGWTINHKKVLAVMRQESLLCHLKRAFHPASPGSTKLAYPNLLKDKAGNRRVVTGLDQVWVVDITYIRLPQGFVYLACVLDAFSRRCIGWHLSNDIDTRDIDTRDIDTRLALAALEQALQVRQPAPGVIHHSDRGVQYASLAYVSRLQEAGMQVSMSAAGCPYDNANPNKTLAESFFKTLKKEEVYLNQYQNFEEAYVNLGRFLEDVYNVKRLHSSLGYLPPTEFEEQFTRNLAFASNISKS